MQLKFNELCLLNNIYNEEEKKTILNNFILEKTYMIDYFQKKILKRIFFEKKFSYNKISIIAKKNKEIKIKKIDKSLYLQLKKKVNFHIWMKNKLKY